MILSAIALWKKFQTDTPLAPYEYDVVRDEETGIALGSVTFSGHKVEDGVVRVFARFACPIKQEKMPAVLVLPDGGKPLDDELLTYFADKGYFVLMPDYSGLRDGSTNDKRTVFPPSLAYANYDVRGGFDSLDDDEDADHTCWFEWCYVALYAIEYLKSRADVTSIGVVGIRTGGEVAWKAMLSPDLKCGVTINAAGWRAYRHTGKFADNADANMSDERRRYLAGIESQSYAPFVKCPVLMLSALHDETFDADRAYDTYARIGQSDGSAIVYSPNSGSCIDAPSLVDMSLFLERNLKGREIYVPSPIDVSLEYADGELTICAQGDEEGLFEEVGLYYAEADASVKSYLREWQPVYRADGRTVKDGKFTRKVTPFAGADTAFVYAYATYLNGFTTVSKITAKKLPVNAFAVKSRVLYSGDNTDCFSVAAYEEYSAAGVFLEHEAVPRLIEGYGGIKGAYSVGGIKTYKISAPRYVANEGALLEFDLYAVKTARVKVYLEISGAEGAERFSLTLTVKGGGKWKRNVLSAAEFKSEATGASLPDFSVAQALAFDCDEETEFAVTNILWL